MSHKEPNHQVRDVLKLVLDDTGLVKLHVIEVITQECPARIRQITYKCRVHTQRFKGDAPTVTSSLFPFNEIEVEKFTATE